jgi:hypothetical protein
MSGVATGIRHDDDPGLGEVTRRAGRELIANPRVDDQL